MQKSKIGLWLLSVAGVGLCVAALVNWKAQPCYMREVGVFMLPAIEGWDDDKVRASLEMLLKERALRDELAVLTAKRED